MSKQDEDLNAVRKALWQLKALGAMLGQNAWAFTRASTVTLTFSVLAFGNGVGMIALAVAEYSWLSEWTRRSALRMGDEQMEQRSTTRPGVVAAILGELQADPLEQTTDALAKLAITSIAGYIAPTNSPSTISKSGFVPCNVLRTGNPAAVSFDLPQGICYPGTSADATDFSIAVPPDEAEHLSSGVANPLWQELDAAIELEKVEQPPEFLQVYFISSRGVLALRAPRAPKIAQQNLMRRWEAVTYFQSFLTGKSLDNDSKYITQTYLDLAGAGLVKTVCSAVTGGSGAVGIVCGDISIDIARLNPGCQRVSEESSRVCSWQTGVFDFTLFTVADDLRPSSYPQELPSQVAYALREMAESQSDAPVQWVQPMQGALTLNWHHDRGNAAESGTQTYEHQAGDGGGFLVDLGRPKPAGPRLFVLLRPREEPLEPVLFIVGGSLLVTLACGLLAMAAIRSGRVNQASEQATILRNLSVAVVRVDENGRIAAANDRAEQVLGTRLPKFGEFDLDTQDGVVAGNRSTFFDVFEGPLFRRNGSHFEHVAEAAIVRARRAGMNSEYFGKLADNDRWIRVAGAPLLARSNAHVLCTDVRDGSRIERPRRGVCSERSNETLRTSRARSGDAMNAAVHDLARTLLDLVKVNAFSWAILSLSLVTGLLKRNVDKAKLSWFASYLPISKDRYSFRILVQNQRDRPLKEKIAVAVDVSRSRLRRGSTVRVVHGPVGENCSARIHVRSDRGCEVVLERGIRALATVVIIGETETIPEGMPLSVGIGADPPIVAHVTRDGLTNLARMRAVSAWWAWLGSLFVCVPLLGFTARSALQKYAGAGNIGRDAALGLILVVALLSALYSAFAFNLCRLRDTPIVLGYSESDTDPDEFVETVATVSSEPETSDGPQPS